MTEVGRTGAHQRVNQDALDSLQRALARVETDEERDWILAQRAKLLVDLYRGVEAVRDYEQLLESARGRGDHRAELDALLGLGWATYVAALDGQDSDVAHQSREVFAAAYDLGRELDDKASMIRALINSTFLTDFWPDYRAQAAANAREAQALSRELGDEELLIDSSIALQRFLDPPEQVERATALVDQLESRQDWVRLKEVTWHLMWAHLGCGNFESCVSCCDAGVRLAGELGAPPVMYATIKALALVQLGRYDAAWESLQEEVAGEGNHFGRAMKELGTGDYLLELRAFEKAAKILQQAMEQAERLKRAWMRRWAQALLAIAHVQAGQLDTVGADALVQESADAEAVPSALVRAEIALTEGRLDEALRYAEDAQSVAEKRGQRPTLVSALEVQLRVLVELERPREVVSLADAGVQIAQEMGSRPMLWRIRAVKAQALEMMGDAEAAAKEYQAAAEIIDELAQTIPDAELRRGFLADALVSTIVAASESSLRKEGE